MLRVIAILFKLLLYLTHLAHLITFFIIIFFYTFSKIGLIWRYDLLYMLTHSLYGPQNLIKVKNCLVYIPSYNIFFNFSVFLTIKFGVSFRKNASFHFPASDITTSEKNLSIISLSLLLRIYS